MTVEFGCTATDLQWVISIYMVTLGAFMVPAGRLADIFGRKRALMAGIGLFGLASLMCAVAPSIATLVRAGEAAGIALTAMITMGGVGVAVAGTMLERWRAGGISTAVGVDVILAALAVALLPAGLLVLAIASRTADTGPRPH